jgi:predicted NACHT family NTPase/tellurite resistance protein
MAKPSLVVSQDCLPAVKQALKRTELTQKELGITVGCSRQPITNFFRGVAIAQTLFVKICDRLGLDWQEIAGIAKGNEIAPSQGDPVYLLDDLDALVRSLRQKTLASIQDRCGTMRILDMSHPLGIEDIYTSVNILEQITGHKRKKIAELLQSCSLENFDRLGFGQVAQERMPGLKAIRKYQKLIILGKPGAGKTTFLKYLAIQCNQGRFEAEHVPIFVTLKDFAEAADAPSLLTYISHQGFEHHSLLPDSDFEAPLMGELYRIMQQGRAFILLDGLDEVRQDDCHRVLTEIRDASEQFRDCHFVITCRIAAWEYTFEHFTEVEVADFDPSQIESFAAKWFSNKPVSPRYFIQYLANNSRIHQLAVSPLLLTLLCLAFEEAGNCPDNRSELYKEGIDALLKKWDAKRGIQRDQVYKGLSLQRKSELLEAIALTTFEQKDYFFKRQWVEQLITDYLRKLPNAGGDTLLSDSAAILQSIEAQHGLLIERAKGIYSFSHLTFHEYFAARQLVFNCANRTATLETFVHSNLTDKRWREIFLLIAEMLPDAALLLVPMQHAINQLLSDQQPLQAFLAHVQQCAMAAEFSFCKPAAVRAFFLDADFNIDPKRSVALLLDRSANLLVCASFLTRMLDKTTLGEAIAIAQSYDAQAVEPMQKITAANSADAVMMIAIQIALEAQSLKADERDRLKALMQEFQGLQHSDEKMGEVADAARKMAKTRRQISKTWDLKEGEKLLLRQYYEANQLLLECLNSDGCWIEPEVRKQIEATLLLPHSINGEIKP